MDDFEATVHSLGNWSLANIPGVAEVRIFADPTDQTAHLEICLREDTWQGRDRAVDAMIEIREMYFDDFSITYSFGETRAGDLAQAEGKSALVFA